MEIADVFRGPLEEFVARRSALVKELRATDAPAAAAAGKLRKPPAAAWAIDQLAAAAPGLLAELLAAGSDVGDAQRHAIGGGGPGDELRTASARLRDAVEAAARTSAGVLERDGHATAEGTMRTLRTTLQAAATGSAGQRAALWLGTLDRELAPPGFGVADAAPDDEPEVAAAVAPLRNALAPARQRRRPMAPVAPASIAARRAAERAAAEQDRQAARARDSAQTRRRTADRLRDQARQAEEDAAAAEREAEDAERRAAEARAALAALGG